MSRGLPLTLALLVAGAAAAPGALAQQDDTDRPRRNARLESPQQLRAQLDSLRPLLEEARRDLEARQARSAEARRLAAARAARIDTLTIGGAMLLTPTEQSEEALELFMEVWEESFADLGLSPSLARSTFAFQWVTDDPVPIHIEGGGHVLYKDRWTTRSTAKREIRGLIAGAMRYDLRAANAEVGYWLMGNALDPEPWEAIYRRVATTSSRVTRACLAGDAMACGSGMALGMSADPGTTAALEKIHEWYTPEERRLLVSRRYGWYSRDAESARSRCVREGDHVACDDFLDDFRFDWSPLGQEVRESLLSHALARGEPGSWNRLLADPAMSPTEALEHASGLPIEELLASWRSELVANRPESFEPLVPSSGRTFLWTLLCAALALRSTRWRLG